MFRRFAAGLSPTVSLIDPKYTCANILFQNFTVAMIPGDGIGPEISASVKKIFRAANVREILVSLS